MYKKYPRQLFQAIRTVESGDDPTAVGENGEIGAYQITAAYWVDATEHAPELGGSYSHVTDPWYAEWVMIAYWERHAPNTKLETLARIHNGGPSGHLKESTKGYWKKVFAELESIDPGLVHADFNIRH